VAPSYPFDQNSNMASSRACASVKPLGRPIFVRIVSVLIALKGYFWNALFKTTASAIIVLHLNRGLQNSEARDRIFYTKGTVQSDHSGNWLYRSERTRRLSKVGKPESIDLREEA
jgi:hypothetical protein